MFTVTLTAETTSIASLRPLDTEENPYNYSFVVSCLSCRSQHPNPISCTRFEQHKTMSRGSANFVLKCRSCDRQSSINIMSEPATYTVSDPPTEQAIVKFETRGCVVDEFQVKEGDIWIVESEAGTKWEVDLGESERDGWIEYDEKAGCEVGIETLKWAIGRGK